MNNSTLFFKAHIMTKQIIKAGDNYAATFGLCLKRIKYETSKRSKRLVIKVLSHDMLGYRLHTNVTYHQDSRPTVARHFCKVNKSVALVGFYNKPTGYYTTYHYNKMIAVFIVAAIALLTIIL